MHKNAIKATYFIPCGGGVALILAYPPNRTCIALASPCIMLACHELCRPHFALSANSACDKKQNFSKCYGIF